MKIENKTLIISLGSVLAVLVIILIALGVVYHFNQLHSFLSVHFNCPGWYLSVCTVDSAEVKGL